jgi:hypothetical protein
MSKPLKDYLGDGVYADFDGFAFVLTTENGVSVTNTIVLEPQVMSALARYTNRIADMLDAEEGGAR